MNRRVLRCVTVLLVCAVSHRARAQVGVWTSQQRSILNGTVQLPTPFGKTLGLTPIFGPVNPVLTAPDFGPWDVSYQTSGGYIQHSSFTEHSFLFGGYVRTDVSGGGTQYVSQNNYGQHIELGFQLSQATPYSFSAGTAYIPLIPAPFEVVSGHAPVLNGPGGQTIELASIQSGVLAAGNWTLEMTIMSLYPTDNLDNVISFGGPPRTAAFTFTVPEPAGAGWLVGGILLFVRNRQRRAAPSNR